MFRRFYIQKVLCSEGSILIPKVLYSEGSIFRNMRFYDYVPKVLYSEGPTFQRFYIPKVLYSEGSMFRKTGRFYILKVLCSKISDFVTRSSGCGTVGGCRRQNKKVGKCRDKIHVETEIL